MDRVLFNRLLDSLAHHIKDSLGSIIKSITVHPSCLQIVTNPFIGLDLEVIVSFSDSFECPMIHFRIYQYDTNAIAEERKLVFDQDLLSSLMMENSLNRIESVIQVEDFDNFGVYYFVHPCQTKQILDQENVTGKDLLNKWWDFYSGPLLYRARRQ